MNAWSGQLYLKPYITHTFRKAFEIPFISDEFLRGYLLCIRLILKFNFKTRLTYCIRFYENHCEKSFNLFKEKSSHRFSSIVFGENHCKPLPPLVIFWWKQIRTSPRLSIIGLTVAPSVQPTRSRLPKIIFRESWPGVLFCHL